MAFGTLIGTGRSLVYNISIPFKFSQNSYITTIKHLSGKYKGAHESIFQTIQHLLVIYRWPNHSLFSTRNN